jgi:predicted aldo/keto reductase-like oxidoreductase
VLAMKALCGGLITNARAAFAYLRQFTNAIPIWGMQKMSELEEFLNYEENPPALDGALLAEIEKDKELLAGNFCRCCGYCLPCPAEIPINNAARITMLLGRMPAEKWSTPEWQEYMRRIDNCVKCGACTERCPYGLDVPALLKKQQQGFFEFVNARNIV